MKEMHLAIAIAICMIIVQVEIFGLLKLDRLNLKLWHAQTELNDSLISSQYRP